MTITEFLLARIAEDEALARKVEERTEHVPPRTPGGVGNLGIVGYPFARVLAEAHAKRAIVAEHTCKCPNPDCGDCGACSGDHHADPTPAPCLTLRYLAAIYADHPDYDQAMRA